MADSPDPRQPARAAKVLHHPGAAQQSARRLLERMWERWTSYAKDCLKQLLLDIDDDLFARADEAESSSAQELYFNSMRLLRYQTDEIRRRFGQTLNQPSKSREGAKSPNANSTEQQLEELTLVDDEMLEQRLAVSTMTERFERTHTLEVLLLHRRVEALREQAGPRFELARIDFDASRLAQAFADALGPLELDLRVRLVLFKHFELQVMEPLGALFREFNQLLVSAGVLPKLDLSKEVRNPSPATPVAEQSPVDPGAEPSADASPWMHRSAHAGYGIQGPGSDPTQALAPGDYRGSYAAGPNFNIAAAFKRRAALMRKLPALRRQRRYSHAAHPSHLLDVGTVLRLLEASERMVAHRWQDSDLERLPERLDLGALLLAEAQRNGRAEVALNDADEDTVNLLQMLFDLILKDDNQAVPMRALIARLQLPMLRVALADSEFFSSSRHPARQFLNAIARAGIGWSQADEKSRDRLYAGIEHLVNRASSSFAGKPRLFETLHADLDTLLAEEAERVRAAEVRVIAQEKLRIEAERTRRIVARLLEHRMNCVSELPADLRRFLERDWQQVLLRAHGRQKAWQSAFAVLRRLTGSGTGPDGTALHTALADGLILLARSPEDARRTASEILALWADLEQEPLAASSMTNGAEARDDPQAEIHAATEAASTDSETSTVEKMPTLEAQTAANALVVHDWVELQTRTGRIARCRLAAITGTPERCIFLNRRGLRIDTMSRLDLARAIDDERLRVLDDRQMFDRALEEVIGGLRAETAAAG
ncbi:MAG: DUF1631 family protein [Gammaproteobacteria bacterium]|nr:MAG: DUF1631 family protein [Gammaproteobacteria bacterium]